MRQTSSKKFRIESPTHFSPLNIKSQTFIPTQYESQTKLSQKIHKLKHALKTAEKHNEQLHSKLKYYKELYQEEVPKMQDQLKRYKKKYGNLQYQHDRKIQQFHQYRVKTQYSERQTFTSNKEYTLKMKDMEKKVFQLEATVIDLNDKVVKKQQQIKILQNLAQKNKKQIIQEYQKKIQKLQAQLKIKSKEAYDSFRQLSTNKDSMKQIIKKLQKANLTIYEQAERYRAVQEELKDLKKNEIYLQKQLQNVNQKVKLFQKQIFQREFDKQKLNQKIKQQINKNELQMNQLQSILTDFNNLQVKYQETLSSNYQLQKDFQKELQIIVKQMARRHMVSKSLSGSTMTSQTTIYPTKKKLTNFQKY